jgi:hypothetical protein
MFRYICALLHISQIFRASDLLIIVATVTISVSHYVQIYLRIATYLPILLAADYCYNQRQCGSE